MVVGFKVVWFQLPSCGVHGQGDVRGCGVQSYVRGCEVQGCGVHGQGDVRPGCAWFKVGFKVMWFEVVGFMVKVMCVVVGFKVICMVLRLWGSWGSR